MTAFFRLYNPDWGDHFYTTSASERASAESSGGYVAEGVLCWVAGHAVTGMDPLYRLYNPGNGDHFYTTSASERDSAKAEAGYQDEDVACWVSAPPITAPYYMDGSWQHADLTQLSGAPSVPDSPQIYFAWNIDAYAWEAGGTKQVVYVDNTTHHIHELYVPVGGPWKHADLTQMTGAPPAAPENSVFVDRKLVSG
jgi:hypothetical protein